MPAPDGAALVALMPFAQEVGVEIEAAAPDRVVGRLPWAPQRCTAGGLMHGGALMTLADSVGAACAYLNLPSGASTATVSSSTSLLRGVRSGEARAVATPLHVGRSFITIVVAVTDAEGRAVAQVTQTQAVIGG